MPAGGGRPCLEGSKQSLQRHRSNTLPATGSEENSRWTEMVGVYGEHVETEPLIVDVTNRINVLVLTVWLHSMSFSFTEKTGSSIL